MDRINTRWGAWSSEFDADNLLGEVVAWDAKCVLVPMAQVQLSLEAAGLDPKLCREIAPPKALRRAVQKIRRTKIVGEVEDNDKRLAFQFTKARKGKLDEFHQGVPGWVGNKMEEYLEYEGEGRIILDKSNGDLDGDDREVVQQVGQMIDQERLTRKTSDVTSIAHKVFRQHADLFPIRQAGGCYFVPARHAGVVDAVSKFFQGVGVQLRRYPIAKGLLTGDTSVRDAIRDGLQGMIDDHLRSINGFSLVTRDGTMSKELDQIKLTRFKIEAYLEYLGEETEKLRQEAAEADRLWQAKVESILEERGEPEISDGRSGGANENGEYHAAALGETTDPAGHDCQPAVT